MKGPAPFETTTGKDIARAAWRLVNECVRDQGNQGGVVSGIGTQCLDLDDTTGYDQTQTH